jgi:acetylornithine deacetylase/succinyl-diaminopimelate desuccinylase-like protein
MPADELRSAVDGLMSRARDDLAELVAFKSVADPKQFPPEECERAAQWVVDAFTDVGFKDVPSTVTLPARKERPQCSCTATTTCSRRSARTTGSRRSGS